ncbi:hypothetical protein CEK62_07185 [Alcanivorax sp. N3-2A]|nr:hypothetical protein CEK62_07185 [Alcanivorax sp. N3-2A]|tara:strand:+ start:21428 stop:22153 length:726 start_codon:yes stop_codon:yes gene_type:complete
MAGGRVVTGWCVGALAVLLLAAGCRYPRDVEQTLQRVQGGVLDVGLTENEPWVVRGAEPGGVEVVLVRRLARQLNARVRWHWGAESELIPALRDRQIDLLVGGLVESPWLMDQVALIKPYQESRVTVGFAAGAAMPPSLEGVRVAVPVINKVFLALRDEGAIARRYADRPPTGEPLAAADWWLRAHGYRPGPWTLITDKHVVALPPGENAWLLRVQKHFSDAADVDALLRAETGGERRHEG